MYIDDIVLTEVVSRSSNFLHIDFQSISHGDEINRESGASGGGDSSSKTIWLLCVMGLLLVFVNNF